MQYNVEFFEFLPSLYYNVGLDTFECDHCQALGFKDENRATGYHNDGNTKCHYGKYAATRAR